jgi:tRNA A37 N6-isopentenylltransferase MiaA
MKISRMILAGSVAVCLLATTTAFASVSGRRNDGSRQKMFKGQEMFQEEKDPIKMLENKKVQIQMLLKDGKITQEQANQRIVEIDKKIKVINEFNSLTLEQKKAKLQSEIKTRLDQDVKDGRLTQAQVDQRLKDLNDKLAKWDGTGYPGFGLKGGKGKGMPVLDKKFEGFKDPIKALENQKSHIQDMLKNGKLTQDEANTRLAKIDEKISEINKFNTLTLEQKKEKLTNDLKDRLTQAVKDGKLTQVKADEILKNFNSKLSTWDGTGYPGFGFKGGFGHHGEGRGWQKNKSMDSKTKNIQ